MKGSAKQKNHTGKGRAQERPDLGTAESDQVANEHADAGDEHADDGHDEEAPPPTAVVDREACHRCADG